MDQKTIAINMMVTGPFPAQMMANGAAVQSFAGSTNAAMAKASAGVSRFGQIAQTVGKITVLAVAAGLALSAKAAIDFESSFAGVRKTVEASEGGFTLLSDQIRRMATEIPISANELNRIAELGGQLGVDISGLATFTDTIAKIGVTTTLTTETAALGFARLDNVLQLNQQSFSNMGSAIVDLGNNFAATEDEILTFALRIAPIGATVGLAADEVLSIATAFTSVGVPAERGGTAIQKTFIKIAEAAMNGGDELAVFADTAGMTQDAFADLAANDPAQALSAFISGLGRIREEGGNVFAILDKVELSNQRVISSLLAMAGAEGVLDDALQMGKDAWNENIALTEEAEKRFGTTASQMTLAKNQIQDLAISLGQGLLPVLGGAADFIGDFMAGFDAAVPDGFKSVILATLGFIAALALSSAAVSKLSTALNIQLIPAMQGATLKAIAMRGALGVGIAGAVAVGVIAFAQWGAKQADIKARTLGLVDALKQEAEGMNDLTAATIKNQLFAEGYTEKLTKFGVGLDTFVEAVMGDATAIDIVNERLLITAARGKEVADSLAASGGRRTNISAEDQAALDTYHEMINVRQLLTGRTDEYAEAVKQVAYEEQILRESEQAGARARGVFPESVELQEHMARLRGTVSTSNDLYKEMAYVAEENVATIEESIVDYRDTLSEAFGQAEEDIRGQINIWEEMGEAVEIDVDKMIAQMQKQVMTQGEFFTLLAQTPMSDTVREWFAGATLEQQAGFVELSKTDSEGWEEFVAAQEYWLGPTGKIMQNVATLYGMRLPAAIRAGGAVLISEMQGVVATMVAEEGIDPADAWAGVIQATLAAAGPELAGNVQDTLYEAFGEGGIPGVDITLQDIYDIIAAAGMIPTDLVIGVSVQSNVDKFLRNDELHKPRGATDTNPFFVDPTNALGNGRAGGGPVRGGWPYKVGERGEELFVPFTNGTIIPNNQLGNLGGRTTTVNVIRPETNDLAGDISEGLTRASISEQVDLIGVY